MPASLGAQRQVACSHGENAPLPLTLGAYREKDGLDILAQGLPVGFDVFHNVHWSHLHHEQQTFDEVDIIVVSPLGHLLLLEIKSGEVALTDQGIIKQYIGEGAR